MPDRVIVFIDAQNMYRGARRAFFERTDYHVKGQFDPAKMGQLLAWSGKPAASRTLIETRVYTGRPDATKDPKTYSAHMKQCASWTRNNIVVIPRMLRYPQEWPAERAQEKGIDVALALDYVTMAIEDKYDVGILVSTDTDMKPALEYVARKLSPAKTVEVGAWRSDRMRSRLSISGNRSIWCHWLDFTKYNYLADTADYSV